MYTYLCRCIFEAIEMTGIVSHSLFRFKCTSFGCASKISAMISREIFITRPLRYTINCQECGARHFKFRTHTPGSGHGLVVELQLASSCSHIRSQK